LKQIFCPKENFSKQAKTLKARNILNSLILSPPIKTKVHYF